jgi:predicted 3-demethylubiquinone-9 3-methyltransferase (glyoxalase superfamily)
MKRITPCLWFDSEAEEAAKFYCSIFKNSKIKQVEPYPIDTPSNKPKGSVMTVLFEINGQEFMGLNGGPMFKLSEAVSFMVMCDDQAEIDHYWNALCGPGSGGEESVCGWLKDKFGLSWQIAPTEMHELMQKGDANAKERIMSAIMKMKKLDLATMRAAAKGA